MPKIPQDVAGPVNVPQASSESFGSGAGSAAWGRAFTQLGQVAQAIFETDMAQRQRAAQIGLQSDLEELETSIVNDPNYTEHEETFTRESKKLVAARRKGLMGKWATDFDNSTRLILKRADLAIKHDTQQKSISYTKASVDEGLRQLGILVGNTDDPVRKDQLRQQAYQMLIDNTPLVFTPTQAMNLKQGFDADLTKADVLKDIREDPAGAFKRILSGEYELEPDQQQMYANTAIRAVDADLKREQAEQRRQEIEVRRAEKQAAEDDEQDLIQDAADGKLTVVGVLQSSLDPDAKQQWLGIAQTYGGGLPTPTRSNVEAMDGLIDDAGRGIDIRSEAKSYLLSGQITLPDYQALLKARENAVFTPVIRKITEALGLGLPTADPLGHVRAAEAKRIFIDWMNQHPEADSVEANKIGDELIRGASIASLDDLAITLIAPDWSGGRSGLKSSDDVEAAKDEIEIRFMRQYGIPPDATPQELAENYSDQLAKMQEDASFRIQQDLLGRWRDFFLKKQRAGAVETK